MKSKISKAIQVGQNSRYSQQRNYGEIRDPRNGNQITSFELANFTSWCAIRIIQWDKRLEYYADCDFNWYFVFFQMCLKYGIKIPKIDSIVWEHPSTTTEEVLKSDSLLLRSEIPSIILGWTNYSHEKGRVWITRDYWLYNWRVEYSETDDWWVTVIVERCNGNKTLLFSKEVLLDFLLLVMKIYWVTVHISSLAVFDSYLREPNKKYPTQDMTPDELVIFQSFFGTNILIPHADDSSNYVMKTVREQVQFLWK